MVKMLVTPHRLNKIVSHMPQVRAAVSAQVAARAPRARAVLARHRRTGASRIESYVAETDGWIVLVDPRGNAAAIEFGRKGRWVERPRWVGRGAGRRVAGVDAVWIPPSKPVKALAAAVGG